MTLTQERLQELMEYSPETGEFVAKVRTGGVVVPGSILGSLKHSMGYIQISVDNRLYLAHRLAWLYMTGEWPPAVDHINRDKTDNRWCNLRIANKSQNAANAKIRSDNKTGYRGVQKHGHRFRARIGVGGGRYKHLGLFDTPEEA